MEIKNLIAKMLEKKAVNMHITAGMPALLNINDRFIPLSDKEIPAEEITAMASFLMNDAQGKTFQENSSVNFTYALENLGRLRVSFYKQKGLVSAIFRPITSYISSFEELQLPEVFKKVTSYKGGLVIIGGPSGSGKSMTLAAILEEINKKRSCHIITLEDPIEYLFDSKKSLFSQREIGMDTYNYPCALREAIHQDADVIMIGEMRDLETMSIALTAAETGILVLATLHTTDAVQAIDRIIDVFPPHQQHQIRTQISITLQRVPVVEIMIVNPAIRNLIREGKIYQIYSVIETCREQGMQTLDQALQDLLSRKLIEASEAFQVSRDQENLKKKLEHSA